MASLCLSYQCSCRCAATTTTTTIITTTKTTTARCRSVVLWRGVEWTREQFRSEGAHRVMRSRPGKPVRWESSLHAFWKSKGAVWTEVETGLWDEHEDQFVAGVGF